MPGLIYHHDPLLVDPQSKNPSLKNKNMTCSRRSAVHSSIPWKEARKALPHRRILTTTIISKSKIPVTKLVALCSRPHEVENHLTNSKIENLNAAGFSGSCRRVFKSLSLAAAERMISRWHKSAKKLLSVTLCAAVQAESYHSGSESVSIQSVYHLHVYNIQSRFAIAQSCETLGVDPNAEDPETILSGKNLPLW